MSFTDNAAYQVPLFYIGTIEANVDMSSVANFQFTAVTVGAASGSGVVGACALVRPSAGGSILGVLQNAPALAEAGQVMAEGVTKAKISAPVIAGAVLKIDANGKFLPGTTGAYACAQALQAGATGDTISVRLATLGTI